MPKLLVVEDSRFTRNRIVDALKGSGYEIEEASNGKDALEMYHQSQPDCIISDLLMPVMDGQELLGQIRAIDSAVPVIISSADIQETSRSQCESLGISAFLNKPMKSEELLNCVAAALNQNLGDKADDAE